MNIEAVRFAHKEAVRSSDRASFLLQAHAPAAGRTRARSTQLRGAHRHIAFPPAQASSLTSYNQNFPSALFGGTAYACEGELMYNNHKAIERSEIRHRLEVTSWTRYLKAKLPRTNRQPERQKQRKQWKHTADIKRARTASACGRCLNFCAVPAADRAKARAAAPAALAASRSGAAAPSRLKPDLRPQDGSQARDRPTDRSLRLQGRRSVRSPDARFRLRRLCRRGSTCQC